MTPIWVRINLGIFSPCSLIHFGNDCLELILGLEDRPWKFEIQLVMSMAMENSHCHNSLKVDGEKMSVMTIKRRASGCRKHGLLTDPSNFECHTLNCKTCLLSLLLT